MCESQALFTRRPSFPCARNTWVLGIPWLSLIYSFISRRVYKHARQLIPGARVSLVLGFPWQSNRETRMLGLSFSHVNASPGITREDFELVPKLLLASAIENQHDRLSAACSIVLLYCINQNKLLAL